MSTLENNYIFQEGMGIAGILLPDGEFWKCGFAQHYMIVDKIPKSLENDCVYFSSTLDYAGEGMIYLGYLSEEATFYLTEEQEEWINKNKTYLDKQQRIDLCDMFRICL